MRINLIQEIIMADVIHTESSSSGIIIGILVALVIAIGAYFIIADRNQPDASINLSTPAGNVTGSVNAE